MDYFAHGFWSYIIFNRIKRPLLAVAFGLLPDTISWVPYGIYTSIISGRTGRPVLSEIPNWTFLLYNISHSLIITSFVILIVFIILKRIPIYIWAWPIAIVMDVLTHTKSFLPTPFLWPVSNWRFPGITWASWQFTIVNYTLIITFLAIIFMKRRNTKKQINR